MFVNGMYPDKSLRTGFFGPGKPWNLVLTGPGKSWKSVVQCQYEPWSCVFVCVCVINVQDPLRREFFLSPPEETTIRRYYEDQLLDFCREFNPPMPLYVMVRTEAFIVVLLRFQVFIAGQLWLVKTKKSSSRFSFLVHDAMLARYLL